LNDEVKGVIRKVKKMGCLCWDGMLRKAMMHFESGRRDLNVTESLLIGSKTWQAQMSWRLPHDIESSRRKLEQMKAELIETI
jgi:hypothetical protein